MVVQTVRTPTYTATPFTLYHLSIIDNSCILLSLIEAMDKLACFTSVSEVLFFSHFIFKVLYNLENPLTVLY